MKRFIKKINLKTFFIGKQATAATEIIIFKISQCLVICVDKTLVLLCMFFFVTMVFCKNYFLEAKIYILEHLSDFDSVFKLYEIQ